MKSDLSSIILQRYVLAILKELKKPRRARDLRKLVKAKRTVSTKLAKLSEHGLVETIPLKMDGRFVNSYVLTEKGRKLVRRLEGI